MKKNEIKIAGLNLIYYELGSGKTLFFRGGRLRALTHINILKELSKNYHVIAPDIPGYGESSTPKVSWSFKDYSIFFDKFMEKINVKEVTALDIR